MKNKCKQNNRISFGIGLINSSTVNGHYMPISVSALIIRVWLYLQSSSVTHLCFNVNN